MKPPEELAEHKPGDTSPGVNGRKNEEGFEHDGEVIPVLHQPAHTWQPGEYLRDADRQSDRAARAPSQVLFARLLRQLFELLFVEVKALGAIRFDELHVVRPR